MASHAARKGGVPLFSLLMPCEDQQPENNAVVAVKHYAASGGSGERAPKFRQAGEFVGEK